MTVQELNNKKQNMNNTIYKTTEEKENIKSLLFKKIILLLGLS
jgi:hypothetical protein